MQGPAESDSINDHRIPEMVASMAGGYEEKSPEGLKCLRESQPLQDKNIPQGLRPTLTGRVCGTTEVVPCYKDQSASILFSAASRRCRNFCANFVLRMFARDKNTRSFCPLNLPHGR